MKVKIFGAGSIGNHLAHASRRKGWEVTICDVDGDALKRTKSEIYPGRYGKWDEGIKLSLVDDAPKGGFDIIIIGTPPDYHIDIARKVIKEEPPRAILIEKPLCTPSLEGAQELYEEAKAAGVKAFVGYNHTLCQNTVEAEKILKTGSIGKSITINAGFQEYWGGIFKAHPWLDGPQDTYLGYTKKGGGASGEHSHAVNIWQHFANTLNLGKIVEVFSMMDYVDNGKVLYDQICAFNVKTQKGYCGFIIQDVVTEPSKKYLHVQGDKGRLEWHVNWDAGADAVITEIDGAKIEKVLPKSRQDDFKWEVDHLEKALNGSIDESPISLERGMDTMMIVAAAVLSHEAKRAMSIDYSSYRLDSIKPI